MVATLVILLRKQEAIVGFDFVSEIFPEDGAAVAPGREPCPNDFGPRTDYRFTRLIVFLGARLHNPVVIRSLTPLCSLYQAL